MGFTMVPHQITTVSPILPSFSLGFPNFSSLFPAFFPWKHHGPHHRWANTTPSASWTSAWQTWSPMAPGCGDGPLDRKSVGCFLKWFFRERVRIPEICCWMFFLDLCFFVFWGWLMRISLDFTEIEEWISARKRGVHRRSIAIHRSHPTIEANTQSNTDSGYKPTSLATQAVHICDGRSKR